MTDKSAKMLERVRALMAKAASTTFPEEADAFRQKADQLMAEYAIEQWQVEELEAGRGTRPVPEKRMMNFDWWRTNPFRSQLWWLFDAVGKHCRCKVVTQKADYRDMAIPVFGIRSDLDWFDMLFTSLMIQMIQKVDPQPRPDMTLNENLAMMREAGMPWELAINRIIKMGETEDYVIEEGTTFDEVYEPWVHGYRRWCRATGHKQSKVNQRTFRQAFAEGFAAEVSERLRRMARENETKWDMTHEAGSMALAVRDIFQQVQEAVYAEWPDLRPHPPGCDCDLHHRCSDPKCQRPNCKAARRPVRMRKYKEEAPSVYAARMAGREAGAKADLSNSAAQRLRNTPEIGKGNN